MASFIITIVYEATLSTLKYSYYFGKYLIYGREETTDDKLERVLKEVAQLRKELKDTSYKQNVHE